MHSNRCIRLDRHRDGGGIRDKSNTGECDCRKVQGFGLVGNGFAAQLGHFVKKPWACIYNPVPSSVKYVNSILESLEGSKGLMRIQWSVHLG